MPIDVTVELERLCCRLRHIRTHRNRTPLQIRGAIMAAIDDEFDELTPWPRACRL